MLTETDSILTDNNLLSEIESVDGKRKAKIFVAHDAIGEVNGVGHSLYENGEFVRSAEILFTEDREGQLYNVKENSREASRWINGGE